MKVVGKIKTGVEFSQLKVGDVFVFEDTLLMKIDACKSAAGDWNMNAVALESGKPYFLPPYFIATPREAEIVLK